LGIPAWKELVRGIGCPFDHPTLLGCCGRDGQEPAVGGGEPAFFLRERAGIRGEWPCEEREKMRVILPNSGDVGGVNAKTASQP